MLYITELIGEYLTRDSYAGWVDPFLNLVGAVFIVFFIASVMLFVRAVKTDGVRGLSKITLSLMVVVFILIAAFTPISSWIYDQSIRYGA